MEEQRTNTCKWLRTSTHKPKQGQNCACIIVRTDGTIKYHNLEDGPWYWDGNGKHFYDKDGEPGVFVSHDDYGCKSTHNASYWMDWEELWNMIESLPRED